MSQGAERKEIIYSDVVDTSRKFTLPLGDSTIELEHYLYTREETFLGVEVKLNPNGDQSCAEVFEVDENIGY